MNIKTKFDINQRVVITEADLVGTVVQIILNGSDLIYKLEYWFEGKVSIVEQSEWQLSAIKQHTPMAFHEN